MYIFSILYYLYTSLFSSMTFTLVCDLIFMPRYNALWSESRYCVSATVQVILLISLHLFWPFIFTEKSDCDIIFNSSIKLVLSVTIIIALSVKLLQMIWGYVTNILMSDSLSLCLCLWCLKDINFISISSSLSTGFQVYLCKCWDPCESPGCTIWLVFFCSFSALF